MWQLSGFGKEEKTDSYLSFIGVFESKVESELPIYDPPGLISRPSHANAVLDRFTSPEDNAHNMRMEVLWEIQFVNNLQI